MDNGIGTIQMRTINTALDRVTVPSYTKGDLTIALLRGFVIVFIDFEGFLFLDFFVV